MNPSRIAIAALLCLAPVLTAQQPDLVIEHFGLRAGADGVLAIARHDGALRVCLGGALASYAPSPERLRLVATLDAVALAVEDLPRATTLVDKLARVPVVCANVTLASSGKPVFASHVVVTVGAQRVAFVGITQPRAGQAPALPQAWILADPALTLAALLPGLAAQADAVVLLAAMDRVDCANLLRRVAGITAALAPVRGGNDPEPLRIDQTYLVQSPNAVDAMARLTLTLDGRRATRAANRIDEQFSSATELASLAEMRGADATLATPDQLLADGLPAKAAPKAGADAAPPVALGSARAVRVTACNRGVSLTVSALRMTPRVGGRAAPAGSAWLVLDTTWRNMIVPAWAFQHDVPPAYQVANLADSLYLVLDGNRLGRLDTALSAGPSGILRRPLELTRPGSELRGDVVFEVPAQPAGSMELRFYDLAHGHFTLALAAGAGEAMAVRAPLTPPQRSDRVEIGVYRCDHPGVVAEATPPPEHEFVCVELRGRSLGTVAADATAFDAAAADGTQVDAGIPSLWKDARRSLRLVTAEGDTCPPRDESSLPTDVRFLPDLHTGGTLVFVVAKAATAFELQCVLPGGGDLPAHFALRGTMPVVAKEERAANQGNDAVPAPNQVPSQVPSQVPCQAPPATGEPAAPLGAGEPSSRQNTGQDVAAGTGATEHEHAAADAEVVPKGLPGVGLQQTTVNAAIERGAAFLLSTLAADKAMHAPLGYDRHHVLMALALVHANVPARDPAFDAELRTFLQRRDVSTLGVYSAGLFCMLIEAYGQPEFYGQLRACARYLVEGQGPQGSWTYEPKVAASLCNDPDRRVLQVTGGVPLSGPPEPVSEWQRVTPWNTHPEGDNSISQFALLGLRAAERCGVPVPAATWERAATWFQRGQRKDGGFGYETSGSESYGSMTLAGICGLAITAHELGEADFAGLPGVQRGLAWMSSHFAIDTNPGSGAYPFYYLYSLERTARIFDREVLFGREWYPLGAQHLLTTQRDDGAWESILGGERDRMATSFALLFLTRATHTLATELKHGGAGTLLTHASSTPDARIYVILDASGSMLESLAGRTKFDAARDAVAAVLADLPPGPQVALRVYGHRKRAIEPGADADTELLVPMGPFDGATFFGKLTGLRARGRTPLHLSLKEALADLQRAPATGPTPGPTTVVLLTDGGDDTRQDPVAAAVELGRVEGLRLHVVGFDIQRADWQKELRAMAQQGHGDYWPAAADNLASELRAAVLQVPATFVLRTEAGAVLREGRFGQSLSLPEGRYQLATTFGGRDFAADFWINTEATTAIVFDGSQVVTVRQDPPGAALCPSCRAPTVVGARFCNSCGTRLGT